MESYADYFITAKYEAAPFQVDVFDRSKVCITSIDVAREVKRAMGRHAITNGSIISLDHIIVPRLKWSDRLPENFEQRKKVVTSMDSAGKSNNSQAKCGLRRLLMIGTVKLGGTQGLNKRSTSPSRK